MSLVLSLFPGIGMLDMAFEEAGYCVVRGPDLLWGGEIRLFHPPPGVFAGVIGGPPCQAFSRLRHLVEHNGYRIAENLIPEFARVVREATPTWWLMENVPQAPDPDCGPSRRQILEDAWVGGATTRRRAFVYGGHRYERFEIVTLALHRPDPEYPVLAAGGAVPEPVGSTGQRRNAAASLGYKTHAYYQLACAHSGLPADFLADAPFTIAGKIQCVGNGVPLAMGRAVARAVRACNEESA